MSNGGQVTGTKDETYGLVSVLFHALEGAHTIDTYVQDAQQAGDQELAQFFQQVQNGYRRSADGAKALLVNRIQHEH